MHHGGAHRPIVAAVDPLSVPPDELRLLGHHVLDRLVDRWEEIDGQPPTAAPDPEWSASIEPCPDGPSDPRTAIDELFDQILPRGQRPDHRRFFAHRQPQQPGRVLADLIGSGHNVFAGSWMGGAGVSALELAVIDWLREWMGMPPGTEGVPRSGGSVGMPPRSAPPHGIASTIATRRRATFRSTRTPPWPGHGGRSASTPPTCACCARTRRTD